MSSDDPEQLPHYTYRVEWSSRYDHYVARCLELPRVWDSRPYGAGSSDAGGAGGH
nr:hypothetical protein [Mycobacterium sp. SMC-4]